MPLLSIIVPIYNVEDYLSDCIESILAQIFEDFELILINDGSSDNSGVIANSYAKRDKRVHVLHKHNGGVSSARNRGIEFASGEFIAFVDPDDTIESNMYSALLEVALLFDTDIVTCPIKTINLSNNTTSVSTIWNEVNCVVDKEQIESQIIPSILVGKTYSLVSCVNKLYKKSLFSLNNVKFDENKSHSEDARLNFELLTIIDSLAFVNQPLYNYIKHKRESLTQVFRKDLYVYILDNKRFLLKLCQKYENENYISKVKGHFTTVTLLHLQEIVTSNLTNDAKYRLISSIINDNDFTSDLLTYKSKTSYLKVLRMICLIKNEKLLYQLVYLKVKLKNIRVKLLCLI